MSFGGEFVRCTFFRSCLRALGMKPLMDINRKSVATEQSSVRSVCVVLFWALRRGFLLVNSVRPAAGAVFWW